jgi:Phage tail tube protein
MALRFAGVAYVTVDGNSIPIRGNLTVSPSSVEREMIAGQDGVHGYRETPRVPFISCDVSSLPDIAIEDLDGQINVTVVVQSASGRLYSLTEGVSRAGSELNTADGQFTIRWDGVSCEEIAAG